MAAEPNAERSVEATAISDSEPVCVRPLSLISSFPRISWIVSPCSRTTNADEYLQSIKINDDSHNVDSKSLSVNGASAPVTLDELENKHITDIVEDLVNSAEPSISGGSDNEAAKGKDDEKGHVRTSSSVKKPTSFKSVSVNRTFLAAKGTPGTAPSKAGDKPTTPSGLTASQPSAPAATARPRLVAKSGSGLGSSMGRAGGSNGGKAAAPDASAVWNKNRRKHAHIEKG